MKQMLFLLILLPFGFFTTKAQSSVYKVTGNGNTVYIGGSIHFLREQDYPLPKAFDEAYYNAEILVFETDIKEVNNPATTQKLLSAMMYQDDRTLKTELKEDVYHKLDSVCKLNGIIISQLDKFTPVLVSQLLSKQILAKIGVTSNGVDVHFNNKAMKDKKPVFQLESVDEQVGFLKNLGEGNENELILYTIDELESSTEMFKQMLESWRKGEEDLIMELHNEFKLEYPDVYYTILSGRNANWIPILESYFETPETEFVIFGAAHLYGPDGVLELLKSKGYKIQQL